MFGTCRKNHGASRRSCTAKSELRYEHLAYEPLESRQLLSATEYPSLTGDINNDGRDDVVVIEKDITSGHPFITSLISKGDGTYDKKTPQLFADGIKILDNPVLMGDVNGDGRSDLVFHLTTLQGISAYTALGQSDGLFAPTVKTFLGYGREFLGKPVQIGDVNGDGRADLVFMLSTSAGLNLRTALGQTNGQFATTALTVFGDGSAVLAKPALIGDVNGDGRSDLIFTLNTTAGLNLRTALGGSNGTFSGGGTVKSGLRDGPEVLDKPVQVGDVNGDGRTDLVFTVNTPAGLSLRTALGTFEGKFKNTVKTTFGDGSAVLVKPALSGDVNGDGRTDLIFTLNTTAGLNIRTALGAADGSFSGGGTVKTGLKDGPEVLDSLVKVADVSGDGRADLVFSFIVSADETTQVRTSLASKSTAGKYMVAKSTTAANGFDIEIVFDGTVTVAQREIIVRAANRWEEVIVGGLQSILISPDFEVQLVDDLRVAVRLFDGAPNVLAQSRATDYRSGARGLPYTGFVEFNIDHLAQLEQEAPLGFSTGLFATASHEIGHILGIGSGGWGRQGLVTGLDTSDPRYTGKLATKEYNAIFGTSGKTIPVANVGDRDGGSFGAHWRESVLDTELMTSNAEDPGVNRPLSKITIGGLADLGYTVDYTVADAYSRPSAQAASLALTVGSPSPLSSPGDALRGNTTTDAQRSANARAADVVAQQPLETSTKIRPLQQTKNPVSQRLAASEVDLVFSQSDLDGHDQHQWQTIL